MSTNKFGPKKTTARTEVKEIFIAPETKKLTVEMDAKLHRQLKQASLDEDRPMRALIEEALEAYLKK